MYGYIPGMVLNIRNRLWRVDNIYKNQLTITSIDGIEVFQHRFYIQFENISVSKMNFPQRLQHENLFGTF